MQIAFYGEMKTSRSSDRPRLFTTPLEEKFVGRAYYNEYDKRKAARLRLLIESGVVPSGDIDTRSIEDVRASDLNGYDQHHFFAGIGGWPFALRLAGWPDDRPVWTGSCPCQPFSTAGSKKGGADKRHLWPTWKDLIKEFSPSTIFGEQVRSAIAFGWLDEVLSDLEAQEYACASTVLPALCGQKGHERYRLWFVAYAPGADDNGRPGEISRPDERETSERQERWIAEFGGTGEMGFLECPDGLLRPVEPSIPLLVDGLSGDLSAEIDFGEAIAPKVAAEFISAFMEIS